ncbi:unnamed protein product [Kuraishia capsulata CBS 1993]|uniref:Vacuolar protein-sorting-associated protein 24 n=1 Tax=Kuraishia capsulata CBS 1993 TaxID=1382522 RepID=W6MFW6_9ASCO|nr:uncharacterized protein KUCA_T00000811001 [Kuraishia capsulata CBS 1993]CDK24844.1 unnamed protein product [Kuraishia capsulata CBS 1993]
MDLIKKAIWGPDPKEQMRKCQALIRKNKRQVDRSIQDLKPISKKTQSLIKQAVKNKDLKTARLYAREYKNIEKQERNLYSSRAIIDSIGMQLNEQQQLLKLQGTLGQSAGIMKDVNSLVSLGSFNHNAQELQKELMKSGIVEEMVNDMMDMDTEVYEDEDEEEEINKILEAFTKDKEEPSKVSTPVSNIDLPNAVNSPVLESQTDDDKMLVDMRERLRALQE